MIPPATISGRRSDAPLVVPDGEPGGYGVAGPDDETTPMPAIGREDASAPPGGPDRARPSIWAPQPQTTPRETAQARPGEPGAGLAGLRPPEHESSRLSESARARLAELARERPADPARTRPPEPGPVAAERTRGPFEPASRGEHGGGPVGEHDVWSPAAAKMDQIKDLYLTAEAIGEDALDKHFQIVSERQRKLIREYFDQAAVAGQPESQDRG